MPPLRKFSGKSICQLLEHHGFKLVRQKGSHRIMQKQLENGTITVPVPLHKDLKAGTLSSIIR
ncbi:type II toxin-antitoxin system HicA family toxin [Verrucomicrobia bacterium]|jgi:predicted RNA binding protein YcfA (HicA-like mRNA interferase family)|nr:type II toxin-antitoxin system HicA family toxin [Verrucomicrobiota bacterium]